MASRQAELQQLAESTQDKKLGITHQKRMLAGPAGEGIRCQQGEEDDRDGAGGIKYDRDGHGRHNSDHCNYQSRRSAIQELYAVDDQGLLFIGPEIEDWVTLQHYHIDTVIDLDGNLDLGVPTIPGHILYIYFPIMDGPLPDLTKLRAVARLGAELVRKGHKVLSHCGLGFNRSALVAGLILIELGSTGPQTVEQLRRHRPGALFNSQFAEFVSTYVRAE